MDIQGVSSGSEHAGEDSAYWRLPAPLAYSIVEMLQEPLINSADELIHLLEAWLRHMGWLWVTEYLRSSYQDRSLDQMLFQSFLEGHRELSVGGWAYVGSRISHLYRRNAWDVALYPMQSFMYGDPRDESSPLSRLLQYRNSFAHGSFDAQEQDILTHRALFWELLKPVQRLLEEAPIVFWDPEHQCVRVADGLWTPRPDIELPQKEPYSPYMMCSQDRYIPLSPMLCIRPVRSGEREHHIYAHIPDVPAWHLDYFSLSQSDDKARRELFQHNPQVARHMQEYQQQSLGFLDFQSEWEQIGSPAMGEEAFQALCQELQEALDITREHRPNFVLLCGYPGSGKTDFVARAPDLFQGFDQIITYRLEMQSPTLSATTFLRYMLRQLRVEDGLERYTLDQLREQFYHQLRQLNRRKQPLLLAIDQFHLAYQAVREDTLSIYDVLAHLHGVSSQHMGVLLTARPGYRDDILHDTQVFIPPMDYPRQEKYAAMLEELGLNPVDFPDPSIPAWSEEERIFRRMLLFVLSAAHRPLTAFETRDVLERLLAQKPGLFPEHFLFSPRVAHTLWELRPLLRWEQLEIDGTTDKVYTPFCESFGRWLRQHLAPA